MKAFLWFLAAVVLLVGCGGGGGGGGGSTGGGTKVALSGRVIWIETGSGPNPPATVRAGSTSTQSDVLDGFFELQADTGVTTVTITFVPTGGSAVVRTFTFPGLTSDTDLGDLYIGPQVVTLNGRVIDVSNNQPISGATVTIAGRSAKTNAAGNFSVANVAYSASNPAVFLGLEGTVTATGFFNRNFNPPTLATGGIVQVGTVSLTPEGSDDPPPPPYDVQGTVTPAAKGANATVVAKQGASVIRRATADLNGRFTLWLPVGTYTIEATSGSDKGTATITVTDTNVIKTINVSL